MHGASLRPVCSQILSTIVAIAALASTVPEHLYAQTTKPAPATPIDAKKAELGGQVWNPAWDEFVEKNIPPEMLTHEVPRDVRKFCPRFYKMTDTDKRAFWAYFFQALAGAEAGLNPTTRVRQPEPEVSQIDPVTGHIARTEGLLQLSYQDAKRYGCDFDWDKDKNLPPKDQARTILQPENNLECGIKILTNQIITEKKPLLYKHGYWSTLQPGRKSYRVFAKQIINPPLACGLKEKLHPAMTTATAKEQQQKTREAKASE